MLTSSCDQFDFGVGGMYFVCISKNALRSSNDVWHEDERIIGFGSGTSSLSYSSGSPGPLENELDVLCDRADATLEPIWHLRKF